MEIFHVTCSTDERYLQHCMAMLCSLFEHHQEKMIVVHLLHHDLSGESQRKLASLADRYGQSMICHNIDESALKHVAIADYHPDLSISTYYRLLLPSLLDNDIHRVLYLDCDVIVLHDLSELYAMDLSEWGVAAVRDGVPGDDHHRRVMGLELDGRAFCAGVMMINLDYWREHHCQDRMLRFANEMGPKLVMEDQDVLNHEFRGHWFELPYKYGRTPMAIVPIDAAQRYSDMRDYFFEPSIIHYAAHVKPWLDIRIPDDKYYWKYVQLSGFPHPVRKVASAYDRKRIKRTKQRYYINFYIRPMIPDSVEMVVRDIFDLLVLLTYVFRPRKWREYQLRRWLHKYNLK